MRVSFRCRSMRTPSMNKDGSVSAVLLAQVARDETGESEDQEHARRDGVELPGLREGIAQFGFEREADADDREVQQHQFEQAYVQRLARPPLRAGGALQGDQREQLVVEERQVGGRDGQRDHQPAGGRYFHYEFSVLVIALRQAPSSGPGSTPINTMAMPFRLRMKRVSPLVTIGELSIGSSNHISLTTRR